VISPVILLMVKLSGVTSPATSAEPSPQVPSIATTERSPVTGDRGPGTGDRVNITPAARGRTMTCTTMAMDSDCSGSLMRRR
jgi:hypothetical protein